MVCPEGAGSNGVTDSAAASVHADAPGDKPARGETATAGESTAVEPAPHDGVAAVPPDTTA